MLMLYLVRLRGDLERERERDLAFDLGLAAAAGEDFCTEWRPFTVFAASVEDARCAERERERRRLERRSLEPVRLPLEPAGAAAVDAPPPPAEPGEPPPRFLRRAAAFAAASRAALLIGGAEPPLLLPLLVVFGGLAADRLRDRDLDLS